MLSFEQLSDGLTARMEYEKATGTYPRMGFDDHKAVRRVDYPTDRGTVWRVYDGVAQKSPWKSYSVTK